MKLIESIPEDIDLLAQLHAKSFKKPWDRATFYSMVNSKNYIGLIEKNGFILGRELDGESEIFTFCVNPAYRKQGLGNNLLSQFIELEKQRSVCKIFLEVAMDNAPAIHLYTKYNFVPIRIRKGYYGVADAIEMTLSLI